MAIAYSSTVVQFSGYEEGPSLERVCDCILVRNYLEVYSPCAGGLSAVNAIGTQPDKLGTDPMAYGGFINGRRRGTREESRK